MFRIRVLRSVAYKSGIVIPKGYESLARRESHDDGVNYIVRVGEYDRAIPARFVSAYAA